MVVSCLPVLGAILSLLRNPHTLAIAETDSCSSTLSVILVGDHDIAMIDMSRVQHSVVDIDICFAVRDLRHRIKSQSPEI